MSFWDKVKKWVDPLGIVDFITGNKHEGLINQQIAAADPAAKAAADTQAKAETERLNIGASYNGLAATILTGGLGDTTDPTKQRKASGVSLGTS